MNLLTKQKQTHRHIKFFFNKEKLYNQNGMNFQDTLGEKSKVQKNIYTVLLCEKGKIRKYTCVSSFVQKETEEE